MYTNTQYYAYIESKSYVHVYTQLYSSSHIYTIHLQIRDTSHVSSGHARTAKVHFTALSVMVWDSELLFHWRVVTVLLTIESSALVKHHDPP